MIRFLDAWTLAGTKLRNRKVRTIITIVIASILFSLVFLMIFVTQGTLQSFDRFMSKSMTGRYIVRADLPFSNPDAQMRDSVLIEKATKLHADLVAEKKKEAKRLGIEYDAASDPSPVSSGGPNGQKMLDLGSPITQKVLDEAQSGNTRTIGDLKKFAAAYHPTAYYSSYPLTMTDGVFKEMKDGKEEFGSETKPEEPQNPWGNPGKDYAMPMSVPEKLIKSYVVPDHTWTPDKTTIPVVVSQKRASTLIGYQAPAKDAPAKTRLEYVSDLRKKAVGKTFSICYRNAASQALIERTISTDKEMAAKKNDSNYVKPSLIYQLPDAAACAAPTIAKDTRTKEEKSLVDKQRQFDQKFGLVSDPEQHLITYEVIGVAPNGFEDMTQGEAMAMDASNILMSMFASQTYRFSIPSEMQEKMASRQMLESIFASKQSMDSMSMMMSSQTKTFYAEFADSTEAKSFIKNESCNYGGMSMECQPKDKYFILSPHASNSIAIDEAKKIISRVVLVATLVVMAIAALITGLTVGRTIADSRRETAVFRAIGFKRFDISAVYIIYTLLLGVFTAICALLIGLLLATLLNNASWLDATIKAQLAFGVDDPTMKFSLIAWGPILLWPIAAIFGAGILGMILPLIRNIRRNPIRDMRDE